MENYDFSDEEWGCTVSTTSTAFIDLLALYDNHLSGLGKEVRAGVNSLVLLFHARLCNILPEFLIPYRDSIGILADSLKSELAYTHLSLVLQYMPCAIWDDIARKGYSIIDVAYPQREKITPISVDTLNNLACISNHATYVISGHFGGNMINYVKEKEDGVAVHNWILTCDNDEKYSICVVGNVRYDTDCRVPFSGELCGDKVYPFYLVDCQSDFPETILIGAKTYSVVRPQLLTIPQFLVDSPREGMDGYIVCVNGVEYKIKFDNTVDLEYNGTHMLTAEGKKYPLAKKIDGPPGIYECVLKSDYAIALKKRPDKVRPQTNAGVHVTLRAPLVSTFKSVIPKVETEYEAFPDVYPYDMLLEIVYKYMSQYARNGIMVITPGAIRKALCARGIVITQEIIDYILSKSGTGRRYSIIDTNIAELQMRGEYEYADCRSIYEFVAEQKEHFSAFKTAQLLANKKNMIVSVKRIILMVMRGELCMSGSHIVPIRVGGYVRSYRRKIYLRPDRSCTPVDAFDGWLMYARNNFGKFTVETINTALTRECAELLSLDVSEETMEEVGDVLLLVLKQAVNHFGHGKDIYDAELPFWKLVRSLPILTVALRKYERRLSKYGCIRNHDHAEPHICSNGAQYKQS